MLAMRGLEFPLKPTIGLQIILIYCAFTYVAPLLLASLVDVPPGLYRDTSIDAGPVLLLVAVMAVFTLLGSLPGRNPQPAPAAHTTIPFLSAPLQVALLAIMCGISVLAYFKGYNNWRYQYESLSERGSPLLLLFALMPTLGKFLLFYYLFYDRKFAHGRGPSFLARKILLCGALLLTANGTVSLLFALLAVVFAFFPSTLDALLLRQEKPAVTARAPRKSRRLRTLALLGMSAGAVALAWALGESIKRGEVYSVVEQTSDLGFVETIVGWVVGRISSSYYSLRAALDHQAFVTDPAVFYDHLLAPLRTFLYRIDYVLMQPFGFERPDPGTLMRINYLAISYDPINPREGTSPGLLAGFLLAMPFPTNYLVLLGYLHFAQRFISRLASGCRAPLTPFGLLLFWPFLLTLFESPIDIMLIVDDSALAMLLLVTLYLLVRKSQRPDEPAAHAHALAAPAG
jgi:hypothetical protein